MNRLRQIILSLLDAVALAVADIRGWGRGRIVAVTCAGPFLAVILSMLGRPVLAVLAFLAGIVFFHAATPETPAPSADPPSDVEA